MNSNRSENNTQALFDKLIGILLDRGAYKANVIEANQIVTDKCFRDMCVANACGMYGKCYMCPPDVGDIDLLIKEIGEYQYALVYQTVSCLEDSYDYEGMVEAKKRTYPIAQSLRGIFEELNIKKVLHLGAGGCGVCKTCGKIEGIPCRFPDLAMPSLESYGINVYQLALSAGMKYINGQNTVTYFGAVLFSLPVYVTVNGDKVTAATGTLLSEILNGEKPCGGHGKCGKCRVKVKGNVSEPTAQERKLLTDAELAQGVRLSCLTRVLGDSEVITLKPIEIAQIVTDGVNTEIDIAPSFLNYGVAIDIGTTTIAAKLFDVKGSLLSEISCLNPQSEWGADVISRIEADISGKSRLLSNAIRSALDSVIVELSLSASIDPALIDSVVITGNTVMLSLLTCESTEPLSHAPFEAKRLFGETLAANELGLTHLRSDVNIYLPPCISAFVGADITCAILASRLCENDTAMLADIGTNGELALWHDGYLTVCSTAAGPAFEGVGISMGMRGSVGAIDKVTFKDGWLQAHVIGDVSPIGICGSGIVDAVACMLDTEILDETGYLEDDPFVIQDNVTLNQKDIRMLQLAKSAICAGILTLIDERNTRIDDLSVLYVAGGFGNYLNKESAAAIGLLPVKLARKTLTVGNAALTGASMILLNSEFKNECLEIARKSDVIELSTNKRFSEHYIDGMMF